MSDVTVVLDAATLKAVSEQAQGSSVQLVVENTKANELNTQQKETISHMQVISTFEAYFESNGQRIHSFMGGTVEVILPFTPENGRNKNHYHLYFISEDGQATRFPTRIVGNSLTGTISHFSDYAIVYDESITNETEKEDDIEEVTALELNSGLKVSQKGLKISVSWGQVKEADGYEVYAQYCGNKFRSAPTKTVSSPVKTLVTIKKLNGKKLDTKKNYKIYVAAYRIVNGKKEPMGRTVTAHIVGVDNAKYTNPEKVKLLTADFTLRINETARIKAEVILKDSTKKGLGDEHAKILRYATSDPKVATVNKKGVITATAPGTCDIWVYARNGYGEKVTVTVQ